MVTHKSSKGREGGSTTSNKIHGPKWKASPAMSELMKNRKIDPCKMAVVKIDQTVNTSYIKK